MYRDEVPQYRQEGIHSVAHCGVEVGVVVALHRCQDSFAAIDLPDRNNHLQHR